MLKKLLLFLSLVTFPASVLAVDFSIQDPVVNNLEISVVASLSASSNYYLQGVIRSQSSSKYFGETKNNKGDWIDYISSPEKEYIVSNFFLTEIQNASWSGQVKLRFKIDDPNYQGPGSYDLKLRRFTGNSTSSAGESNTLLIQLTVLPPTPTPTPFASPEPSVGISPSPSSNPSPTQKPLQSPSPKPTWPTNTLDTATVAGATTQDIDLSTYSVAETLEPTSTSTITPALQLNASRAKSAILVGSGLMLTSLAAFLGIRRYRRVKPPRSSYNN